MTKEETVYFTTLELLGSDDRLPEIQAALNAQHAKADSEYARLLEERREARVTAQAV